MSQHEANNGEAKRAVPRDELKDSPDLLHGGGATFLRRDLSAILLEPCQRYGNGDADRAKNVEGVAPAVGGTKRAGQQEATADAEGNACVFRGA
ncbi:hypothetical protein AWV80_16810 [Cupriavidus sp. UYMU48A]|nr:hypothetical protein AWV80_16810 [Cupriavidus sp. UYMU48A]